MARAAKANALKKKSSKKRVEDKISLSGLPLAISLIRQKFGEDSLVWAGDLPELICESTGSAALDFACGGYPYGRYIHIFGNHSAGKTFLALLAVASMQRSHPKGFAVWLDIERVFDKQRARRVGVDLDRLIIIPERSVEKGLSVAETFSSEPDVKIFVVDSIAAISTDAEINGEITDFTVGSGARLLNKFLRRWTARTSVMTPSSFVILLNQTREVIKKGGPPSPIPPKPKPTCGRGLRYFASLELEVQVGDRVQVPEKDVGGTPIVVGQEVKCMVEKNNFFPPYRLGVFLLCWRSVNLSGYWLKAHSVDNARDLLNYASHYGIIQRSGAWFSYGERRWQGKIAVQKDIQADSKWAARLYDEIWAAIKTDLTLDRIPPKWAGI